MLFSSILNSQQRGWLVSILNLLLLLPITLFAQTPSDTVKSEAYYEKLVEDRLLALDLHNAGYGHFRRGDYDSAIIYYNQAIALDSNNAHYFSNRGNSRLALEDWEGALADYERSNRMDPGWTHENAFFSAEILRQHLGRADEALALYDSAVVYMLQNSMPVEIYRCYLNKGNIHIKAKRYAKAIEAYTQALKYRPNHLGSLANRGVAFIALGKKEEACNDWKLAASLGSSVAQKYRESYCD